MRQYTRLLLFLMLLVLSACSTRERGRPTAPDADPGAIPDLSGKYVVNGVDPLGTEYGGHLTIRPGETEGEYLLQWIVVGSIQEGRGYVEGNQLIVEWYTVEGMVDTQGRGAYTITQARELYGTRTVDGDPRVGEEIAFPND